MTEETPLPLPVVEPTTVPAVKLFRNIEDDADDARIAPIVDAVCSVVRGLPVAEQARGAETWPAKVKLGATMMAARLWSRKDSPEGVASFASDGPVYVQRNDPDVAMLLELGDWSKPAVG